MHISKGQKSGFSLIELMVVIGIIAVLSAIAVPAYLDHANRAKLAEVFAITERYKKIYLENYSIDNSPVDTDYTSGVGNYISSVSINYSNINSPRVTVLLNNNPDLPQGIWGTFFYHRVTEGDDGELAWDCEYTLPLNPEMANYVTDEECYGNPVGE